MIRHVSISIGQNLRQAALGLTASDSQKDPVVFGDRCHFAGIETHCLQKANTAMYDRCFFMLSSMVLSWQRGY
jgi:hypothetical protein